MALTVNEAKKHLNIDATFTDDDNYVSLLIDVAKQSVKNAIRSTSTDDVTATLPLKHACLLIVGNLYANREPVAYSTCVPIPYTFQYLIDPYIDYSN